jgi:hypothetical protein
MSDPVTVFDSLNEAIAHAFKVEQTSILTLARICSVLSLPSLYIKSRRELPVPCSTITRRRISSTLSSSELFVRAGPARAGLWAIRPNNPLFLSDSALSTSIEQMLTAHGPLSLEQFAELTDLTGIDCGILETFMVQHNDNYALAPDGSYWFAGQKRPTSGNFESMGHALLWAFAEFPEGASVEEMHWLLCLSTVGGSKRITRRSISRELSRRTDLFAHVGRARYVLVRTLDPRNTVACPAGEVSGGHEPGRQTFPSVVWGEPPSMQFEIASMTIMQAAPCAVHEEEDEFNPFAFFGGGSFEFAHP